MTLGYVTICWGNTAHFGMGIVGHPVGITNIKDLVYVTNGSIEEAVRDLARQDTRASSCSMGTCWPTRTANRSSVL